MQRFNHNRHCKGKRARRPAIWRCRAAPFCGHCGLGGRDGRDGPQRFFAGFTKSTVSIDRRRWLLFRSASGHWHLRSSFARIEDNLEGGDMRFWAWLLVAVFVSFSLWAEEREIRTPKPSEAPRINGARVYGAAGVAGIVSGALHRCPAHCVWCAGPAEALAIDKDSGTLTGRIEDRALKTYNVALTAENAQGKAERELRIVVGDTLALTPPMGWNHWYAHYDRITDEMMREAADVMVSQRHGRRRLPVREHRRLLDERRRSTSDPKRVGPLRDAEGNILPNKHFPDMKALTDYIHAKGLKAGHLHLAGAAHLRGFRGRLRARGAGRAAVRRLGLRFPEVRLVLATARWRKSDKSLDDVEEALPSDGRSAEAADRATSCSTSASTAWATSGSGAPRSAASAGARRATWASSWTGSSRSR